MKLKFNDKRIHEFFEGGLYFANDGQPFEVPTHQGGELLKAVHVFKGNVRVPVFALVGGESAQTKAEAEEVAEVEREKIEAEAAHAEELQAEVAEIKDESQTTKKEK